MSDRFYKVFVSSTYEDLKEERQEVFDALLKSNCFPVGMEHFPSSNLRSLELIKKYIDQCDYYVMISAGVYGSIVPGNDPKISYVEWEYDYAQGRLPCYSFIHVDPDALLGAKLEKINPKLLTRFRQKVLQGKHIAHFSTPGDLSAKVLHAFQHAPNHDPAVGWIRADRHTQTDSLIGTWQLVASTVAGWQETKVFKVFTANEFIWLQVDPRGPAKFILGSYTRDAYSGTICEVPNESSFPSINGKLQEYSIDVDGDTLQTEGLRSTGVMITEQFRRVQ